MFKNLFSRKGKDTKKKEGGAFASAPAMSGEAGKMCVRILDENP